MLYRIQITLNNLNFKKIKNVRKNKEHLQKNTNNRR
jgi:hypothetical protein